MREQTSAPKSHPSVPGTLESKRIEFPRGCGRPEDRGSHDLHRVGVGGGPERRSCGSIYWSNRYLPRLASRMAYFKAD